jgi:alpha-amylase
MPALCLYFQVHQPYRLRPFSFFEVGAHDNFFDVTLNREIMQRVAARCYLPTGRSLIAALNKHGKKYEKISSAKLKLTFSITGTAIEQMREYAPQALSVFKELVGTGCVELLGETYYHSLAGLCADPSEFIEQVRLHSALIESEFGVVPRVFRNTELIFSDLIGAAIRSCGFAGAFVEGIPDVLAGRTPNALYRGAGSNLKLLPRNFKLSDLIAFKLLNGNPMGGRLSAADLVEQIKGAVGAASPEEEVVFICLDYETFGEHHQGGAGVCDLIEQLADQLLRDPDWRFVTPSEVIEERIVSGELHFPSPRSWADTARDLSPWLGNQMQTKAFQEIYAEGVSHVWPKDLWRKLQTSDHLYYMSNKGGPDGVVHKYFRPFESPYDAFVAYMNVVRGIKGRSGQRNSTAIYSKLL